MKNRKAGRKKLCNIMFVNIGIEKTKVYGIILSKFCGTKCRNLRKDDSNASGYY